MESVFKGASVRLAERAQKAGPENWTVDDGGMHTTSSLGDANLKWAMLLAYKGDTPLRGPHKSATPRSLAVTRHTMLGMRFRQPTYGVVRPSHHLLVMPQLVRAIS